MTIRLFLLIAVILFSNFSNSETESHSSLCMEGIIKIDSKFLNQFEKEKERKRLLVESLSKEEKEEIEWKKFVTLQENSLNNFMLGRYELGLQMAIESSVYADKSYKDGIDLSFSYSRAGINLEKMGYLIESLTCIETSYAHLIKELPLEKDYRSHVAWDGVNLARLKAAFGKTQESQALLNQSISLFKILFEEEKEIEKKNQFFRDYLNSLAEKIGLLLDIGDLARAKMIKDEYLHESSKIDYVLPIYDAFAHKNFAILYIELSDYKKAKEEIKIAQDILKTAKLIDYYLFPILELLLSQIASLEADHVVSYEALERAINFINNSRLNNSPIFTERNEVRNQTAKIYAEYFTSAFNLKEEQPQVIEDSFINLQKIILKNSFKRINLLVDVEAKNKIKNKQIELVEAEKLKSTECNEILMRLQTTIPTDTNKLALASKQTSICFNELTSLKKKLSGGIKKFIRGKPADLKLLQSILRADDVLISYFFNENASFAWIASGDFLKIIKIETPLNEIKLSVMKIKESLIAENPYELIPFDDVASRLLYEAILSPLMQDIKNKKNLIVVKNDLLKQLPLSVLITNKKKEKTWLFQKYDIVSIEKSSDLIQKKLYKNIDKFYGFGMPIPKDNYGKLPNAKKELIALGKGYSARNRNLFLGSSSTKENLGSINLNGAALAFSTHAIRPLEVREIKEPALLLEDWLSAKEIAFDLSLNANLVILSACNTAWSSNPYQEPVLDLPTAFIISGSHSILVSNWNIEDRATKDIMASASNYIYENRGKENLILDALRVGMNEYLEKNEDKFFNSRTGRLSKAHPYFWAPFELVGIPQ